MFTMSADRNRVLSMLAAGKITTDEAERLLDALETGATARPAGAGITGDPAPLIAALPKYLYVQVSGSTGDNQINRSMSEHGMSVDLSNLKPEDIDELVESLREMEINVDGKNGDVVRVYCA